MKTRALLLATILTATPLATAEVIEISVSQQSPELQMIERPQHGLSKAQVEQHFGAPHAITQATGSPPISSWSYEDFTVYFEYDTVLHSVLSKKHSVK